MNLTIDALLWSVWSTLLNPILTAMLTLTLAARSPSWQHAPLQLALTYTGLVWMMRLLLALDARGYFLLNDPQRRPRTLDWSQEVVLVTGGAGGLGGLIADIYAMRGVAVAVVDILDETPERVREWDARGAAYFHCDVGDADAVAALKGRVEAELGVPTILVNAAATVAAAPLLGLDARRISRAYATNLHAHAYLATSFLPGMLAARNGGTIVSVSSVLGQLGCAGLGLYASSKAAVTALHRSLAAELPLLTANGTDASAIRLLLVQPGQLSTPLFAQVQPPSSFFGPVVPAHELARRIVERVDAGTGGELLVPLYSRWIAWFGVLPPGLRAAARWWAGLDASAWAGFVEQQGQATADKSKHA